MSKEQSYIIVKFEKFTTRVLSRIVIMKFNGVTSRITGRFRGIKNLKLIE